MTFRKHVMISIVLLCVSGLLLGCSDDDSAAPTNPVDEAPPARVIGLMATMTANGVELTWMANSQTNLRGYNVYRHISSESAIAQLNSSPVSENRYVDQSAIKGPVYQYLVTSVTTRGTESIYTTVTINTDPTNEKGELKESF